MAIYRQDSFLKIGDHNIKILHVVMSNSLTIHILGFFSVSARPAGVRC